MVLFQLKGPNDHGYFDYYPPDEDTPPDELSGWDHDFWGLLLLLYQGNKALMTFIVVIIASLCTAQFMKHRCTINEGDLQNLRRTKNHTYSENGYKKKCRLESMKRIPPIGCITTKSQWLVEKYPTFVILFCIFCNTFEIPIFIMRSVLLI